MKIIYDLKEFRSRTGLLIDLEFEPIDLIPNGLTGLFERSRLPELIAFCDKNRNYHIISLLRHGQVKVNTIVEAAALYMIGNGDNDPDIMYVPHLGIDRVIALEIQKFDID